MEGRVRHEASRQRSRRGNGAQAGCIGVLVVDEQGLFRIGLVSGLGAYEDIEVLAQTSNGKMAIRLAGELHPTVVLMDLHLPDAGGPEVVRAIREHDDSIRVVVLTSAAEGSDVAAAVDAGASGYLTKDSSIEDVVSAIRAAAQELAWLSPQAARTLLENVRRTPWESADTVEARRLLSPREIEVLHLVARGLDNNEIAHEMSISPPTVKNHVSNILGKLGMSNRIQAAVYAVRHGIA
jgi:DNA-binding NarL/FixJ family response regulator